MLEQKRVFKALEGKTELKSNKVELGKAEDLEKSADKIASDVSQFRQKVKNELLQARRGVDALIKRAEDNMLEVQDAERKLQDLGVDMPIFAKAGNANFQSLKMANDVLDAIERGIKAL